jgi:hypothetical protein
MSQLKKVILFIVILSILFVGFRFVRGGQPADVALVKKACGVFKNEDGKWTPEDFKVLFPGFKSEGWNFRESDPEIILRMSEHYQEQAISAINAAVLNPDWRPLADALVEHTISLPVLYAYITENINADKTYELQQDNFISYSRIRIECRAFGFSLNS